jgi:hypothetical protein
MKVLLAAAALAAAVSCRATAVGADPGVAHPELEGVREHLVEGLAFGDSNHVRVDHTFRLTNTGRDAIVIEDARVTTSTVLVFGPEHRRIDPGGTVDLDLGATLWAPETTKRGRAMLTTSDGETIELVLELRIAGA